MVGDIRVGAILERLGSAVVAFHGSRDATFSRALPITIADHTAISFCRAGDARAEAWLRQTKAAAVFVGPELKDLGDPPADVAIIVVADPRLELLRVVRELLADPKPVPGVHPSAVVHPEAEVDPSAYIGPGCNVGRCRIGAGVVLHGNIHLYDRVRIGKNVIVHAGTVIGSSGFGYQRSAETDEWEHFPHIGGVVIEDDVEIGANTCIDRGTMADTVVRRGTKIDNLVHIAHNVTVGEHALVISGAQVAGSVTIGDHAWIAPGATIIDNVKIGRETTIGLGSVVVKDVPDYGKTMGQPAALLPERFWNKPRA